MAGLISLVRRRSHHPVTRIIAFHKVKDPALFERKVQLLGGRYNPVRLKDFLEGRVSEASINVVVTFDDGYRSWLHALPILRRYGVPAVFFVNSGYLDATEQDVWAEYCRARLGVTPEPSITWDELRDIAREDGFEIGGHTVNHVPLGPDADPDLVWREISEDKKRIELESGKRLSVFAYPFGHAGTFCAATSGMVQRAGYEAAVTLVPGANLKATQRFLLHRDGLDDVNSPLLLRAWLAGAYDPMKGAIGAFERRARSGR